MNTQPQDNLEPDRGRDAGTSPPQFKCDHCGASANKRTRDPFTLSTLNGHRIRCLKRPSSTVENTLSNARPSFDSRTPTKSTSSTVEDSPLSLSPREKEETQPPSEAAAVKKEEESVAALWRKYRYDRIVKVDPDNGRETRRPAFTAGDHYFMGVPYHLASKKVRAQQAGIIEKLRAYVYEVRAEEADTAREMRKNLASTIQRQEKEAADKQRRIEEGGEWWLALNMEEKAVHDAAFWTESARLLAELPAESEPVEPDPFMARDSFAATKKITHEDLCSRVAEEMLRRQKGKT